MKMPFLLIRPKIVLKNLLIKKGGCFEYHKIEYRYIHRASICPASWMDRRSFFVQNHGQIQEIGGVLSQSRRLPPLQVVSNSKFVSAGVHSPTEINAPRGCAVILIGICQLRWPESRAKSHGRSTWIKQACLCRRQAERLSLLLLLDEWQKGLPSG